MSEPEERLRELGARVERLALSPSEVARERPLLRMASPLFRLFRWRLEIRTDKLRALLDGLRNGSTGEAQAASLHKSLEGAIDELDENVTAAERATIVCGVTSHGPVVGWLTRLHEVVARALLSLRDPNDESKRKVALAPFTDWALSSLSVRSSGDAGKIAKVDDAPSVEDASAIGDVDNREPDGGQTAGINEQRLIDLELAAVDRLLDAGRAETHFLGRRRRLFEAARKLLLDAAAAMPLDASSVNARAQHVADEIVLINRLEAAGVDPDVGLSHQALSALSRGDRQKLYASLRASALFAGSAGDIGVASRAEEALKNLDAGARKGDLGRAEAERSAREILGDPAVQVVRDAYEAARREVAFRKTALKRARDKVDSEEQTRVSLWDRYLHDEAVMATLTAAVSVDGCFEVGGTLAPVRVEEQTRRVRIVSYPTQDMVLVPSGDARDLPTAVIDDPRGVILALAEGRLLARRFLRVDEVRAERTRLVSEARIYVLDGSDSMLMGGRGVAVGARARMRDAILLAELATLYRRATVRGRKTKVVLFYRYFSKVLGAVTRVESASDALSAMADVVETPRHGGTDIQAALLASFEQIREARENDPDLARAQIVLVTDGEAAVDEDAVRAAREREGDFPIGVSVIALGEENPVLRRLAARQRARGEPVFYHFVSDDDLSALVRGARSAGARVHLPEGISKVDSTKGAERLTDDLRRLVEEIDAFSRAEQTRPVASPETMGTADVDALREVGIVRHETEGERAFRELRERDERALSARFDAWFPPLAARRERDGGESDDGSPDSASDAEAAVVVLTALVDVLADLGGTQAERHADAVALLERLLPDARLSPARYLVLVRRAPQDPTGPLSTVAHALRAIRDVVTDPRPTQTSPARRR